METQAIILSIIVFVIVGLGALHFGLKRATDRLNRKGGESK